MKIYETKDLVDAFPDSQREGILVMDLFKKEKFTTKEGKRVTVKRLNDEFWEAKEEWKK